MRQRLASPFAALTGLSVGLFAGWMLWGDPVDVELAVPSVAVETPWQGDAVLVVAVETPENLEAVRRSVAEHRVVASSEEGFAFEPHRLVVTRLEATGPLLGESGWNDRPLEIVRIARRDRDAAPDPRLAELAELVSKPTLTRGEAYRVLGSM